MKVSGQLKDPPVPIEQEAGLVPELVWMIWRRMNLYLYWDLCPRSSSS
jgi:hypothetical protein